MPRWRRSPSRRIVCRQSPPLPGCHLRACSWLLMPATMSQESPPSLDCGKATPARRRTRGPSCRRPLRATRCWPAPARRPWGTRGRLRLLELLAQVGRAQHLHAERRRCSWRRRGAAFRGCRSAWRRRPRRVRTARAARTCCRLFDRLGDEQALLGTDGEDYSFWHVQTPEWTGASVATHATSVGKDPDRFSDNQPPETAGRMMISSPGTSGVSSPFQSRMWSLLTNKFSVAHRARIVADAAIQRRMSLLQFIEYSAERLGRRA